jgi:alginate O-acetyltransferase complex protein AlgI
MLFNTFEFLFLFLPLTLAVYYGIGRVRAQWARAALVLASLVFYAMWDWRSLGCCSDRSGSTS